VSDVEESKKINEIGEAVVLAGSGMCNGGRIVHHLKNNLFRETTDVVFVGYQAKGTLGRRLVEGEKTVRVAGEEVNVKAKLHTINGFSAHADRRDLLAWAKQFRTDPLFFITHGELESAQGLSRTFEENGIRSLVPSAGKEYNLVKAREKFVAETKVPERVTVLSEAPCRGLGRMESLLCEIVSLATDLREDGVGIPEEEAVNLAVSARTLLETLGKKKGSKQKDGKRS
jgi:metallo-beta-lactamase family protein